MQLGILELEEMSEGHGWSEALLRLWPLVPGPFVV